MVLSLGEWFERVETILLFWIDLFLIILSVTDNIRHGFGCRPEGIHSDILPGWDMWWVPTQAYEIWNFWVIPSLLLLCRTFLTMIGVSSLNHLCLSIQGSDYCTTSNKSVMNVNYFYCFGGCMSYYWECLTVPLHASHTGMLSTCCMFC